MPLKFTITFEITPTGQFGLPEAGKSVVPTGTGFKSIVLHVPSLRAGKFVKAGHETLSKYRDENDKINQSLDLGNVKGRITDNFLFLDLEADNYQQAYAGALDALNSLLQHLSVNQGIVFKAKPLIIVSEDERVYPLPKISMMASFKTYNLNKLISDIEEAERFSRIRDRRLMKALEYFEHSLLLYEQANQLYPTSPRHYLYLISSIFLNLWKCITTIVGDPSRSKDSYQKRYRQIGLKEEHKAKIDSLKSIRDNYDVAHYALTDESLKKTASEFGTAVKIASEVIKHYRQYLFTEHSASNDLSSK